MIKKGTAVIVSLLGLSRDPVNFPDPETFRPERFSNEVPTYNTEAYIPFGDGPRACIGKLLERYMTAFENNVLIVMTKMVF